MLEEFLMQAVEMGADRLEIEIEDGARCVSAFRDPTGISIAWLDRTQWDVVYRQMQAMKNTRKTVLGGTSYRLAFSQYDSFGEWVFVIRIREAK